MFCLAPSVPINRLSLKEMAEQAGVAGSLQICLDPACMESYPGSGQIFYDLSGNGRHFYLGTNATVEAGDPTFSGTAGSLDSTCWFNGGNVGFRAVNANDSFINGLSTPNWVHSFVVISYWNGTNSGEIFSTKSGAVNSANYGLAVYQPSSTNPRGWYWLVYNGTNYYTNQIGVTSPTVTPPSNQPYMWGLGMQYISVTSKVGNYYQAGVYQTLSDTSSWTASTTVGGQQAMIGDASGGSSYLGTGTRFYGLMLFSSYLSQSNYDTLRSLIQKRHPGV